MIRIRATFDLVMTDSTEQVIVTVEGKHLDAAKAAAYRAARREGAKKLGHPWFNVSLFQWLPEEG